MVARRISRQGRIPWDQEGFLEAFARWQAVVDAPQGSGQRSSMGRYFVERYGRETGLVHFERWLKIGEFLAKQMSRLHRAGLVWAGPDGSVEMSEGLIQALCVVPLRPTQRGRRPTYRIDAPDVFRRLRPGTPARRPPARGKRNA